MHIYAYIMTLDTVFPTAYITRWSARPSPTRNEPSTRSPSSNSSQTRKYNTSCDRCRKSRVKCSGGVPCRRCETSSNTSSCVYSLSQRRGKRKASISNGPPPSHELPTEEFSPFDMDMVVQSNFSLVDNIDPNLFHDALEFDQPLSGQDQGGMSGTSANANSPSLTEIVNALESSPSTQTPSPRPRQRCPNACYTAIHELNSTLDAITRDPGHIGLDEILMLFQRAFHQSAQYLACDKCDAGCPRHINLAMLHQRQVTLLCELAKTPEDHLSNDTTRASLGSFQPSKQDDLSIKQLMLRQATRHVKISVEAYHEGAKGFEERYIAGTLELGDAGKLNLKWLLDVSENLRRRLDCVRVLLERDDWAAKLRE